MTALTQLRTDGQVPSRFGGNSASAEYGRLSGQVKPGRDRQPLSRHCRLPVLAQHVVDPLSDEGLLAHAQLSGEMLERLERRLVLPGRQRLGRASPSRGLARTFSDQREVLAFFRNAGFRSLEQAYQQTSLGRSGFRWRNRPWARGLPPELRVRDHRESKSRATVKRSFPRGR